MTNSSDKTFDLIRKGGIFATELADLIIGREIGTGASRMVFENLLDKTTVIKVENASRAFNNVAEWDIWCNYEGSVMEKWLAPCVNISSCGIYLIQKKTTVASVDQYPAKVPTFFTDLKYGNWGLYEDRLVCHDYANNRLYRPEAQKNLVNADWWKEVNDVHH